MPAKLAKADITPVRQRTQFSCLAASMSMALKCHGQGHCDEDTVNKVMGAQPMRGASWEQALACAQHYGMRGTLTSPCTLKQLKAWTDAGTPVLIAWNPEGREWSHASLVFDVDDDENVHVADPNIPDPDETVRVVPKSEFYAKWYEKWPNYLVRRPAMAIEREITPDGRQVMASDKGAVFFHGVTRGMDRLRREKQDPVSRGKTHREPPPSWEKMKGKPSFEDYIEGKKFKNPETGNEVQFNSLPKEEQERLRSSFQKQNQGEDKKKSWLGRLFDKTGGEVAEGFLTQPLMTRRDYGAVTASDYASILKYAVNLPADVERYVEDIKKKNPDYSEGQAWATAWSIYCKYKNPGSEHCQMNKSDYFPGRTAAGPYEILYRVPGKGGFKTKGFKDQSAAQKWVEKFLEKEGDDVEVRWPAKTAKFPAGVTMTVDEVADVVGPEFKEMNEDPPPEVVKVKEEMQKKARRSLLLARDAFAEMLRDGKFEKGVTMTVDEVADVVGPEFKEMNVNPPPKVVKLREEMTDKTAAAKLVWKVNRVLGAQYAETPVGTYWIYPEENFYYVKLDNKPLGHANPSRGQDILREAKALAENHYVSMLNSRTAAVTAGGKWGFTKGTESACTAGVNKLQKAAKRIANALYAKDEGSVAFLQKHAARAGSKTASMLLTAMEDIGPAAMLRAGKTAGKSGNGLYGFSEKTAKLGLDACSALHHEAGVIAADLFARKGSDPVKVAGYLAANAQKGKCAYSAMLAEVAPDVALEVTGTVKKKATDFLASDENADDEVADIISKC